MRCKSSQFLFVILKTEDFYPFSNCFLLRPHNPRLETHIYNANKIFSKKKVFVRCS